MQKKEFHEYQKPSVTVDIIVFTVRDNNLQVLLVKRNLDPFKNMWAIPGGFIKMEESLEDAARRELEEETGLEEVYLEQLYSFGHPKRDPRGRVITIAYLALVNSDKLKIKADTDVSDVEWFPVRTLPKLAFDHQEIVEYSLKRLRWKFEYTSVAFSFLSKEFTLSQLQNLYEIVFDKKFDKRNFRKKILSLNILKKETVDSSVDYRPPQLYSLKKNIPEVIEIIKL